MEGLGKKTLCSILERHEQYVTRELVLKPTTFEIRAGRVGADIPVALETYLVRSGYSHIA